jgi:hypothetical protein
MDGMTPDTASPPSSVSERRGSTRSGQILARLRYPVWHGSGLGGPSGAGTDMDHVAGSGRWPVYAAAVVDQAGVGTLFALPLQLATINLGCSTCTAGPPVRYLPRSCAMR